MKYNFSPILIFIALLIGNYMGDAATLRDCSTTGEAKMLSGGVIKCEVVRVLK